MARPYFTGNYGSSLARVDTRPIIEAGRATGQMYANLGGQVGGRIKEYGLNKAKKEKATREVEGSIRMNPGIVAQLTGTGDEDWDKKQNTAIEKLKSGDLNLAGVEGLAGDIARLEKQDLREAEGKRQALIDALKVSQLNSEEQARRFKEENQGLARTEATRKENMYKTGDSMIHNILAEAHNNPDFDPAKLSLKNQKIFLNWEMWQNRQYPLDEFIGKPGDEVDQQILKQQFKNAQQAHKEGKFGIKLKKVDLERKEADLLGGDYDTWEDAAAKQDELYEAGFVTTAKLNPNGGVDIISQTPIADAEEAGEFKEVTDFPGHFVRPGDSHLYRKDDAGKLQQVGAPTNAQEMGQLQAYINSIWGKREDEYMTAMDEGKLIDKKWDRIAVPPVMRMLPQSEWRYELDGEDDVPYNTEHEKAVRRIKTAQAKMDNYFDIDITR